MPREILDNQECRSCEHFRWVQRRCVLDRDEFYEGGILCRAWEKIIIRKREKP